MEITKEKKTKATKKKKRLSKLGEFMRKNPNGIGEIIDMRAVLK